MHSAAEGERRCPASLSAHGDRLQEERPARAPFWLVLGSRDCALCVFGASRRSARTGRAHWQRFALNGTSLGRPSLKEEKRKHVIAPCLAWPGLAWLRRAAKSVMLSAIACSGAGVVPVGISAACATRSPRRISSASSGGLGSTRRSSASTPTRAPTRACGRRSARVSQPRRLCSTRGMSSCALVSVTLPWI